MLRLQWISIRHTSIPEQRSPRDSRGQLRWPRPLEVGERRFRRGWRLGQGADDCGIVGLDIYPLEDEVYEGPGLGQRQALRISLISQRRWRQERRTTRVGGLGGTTGDAASLLGPELAGWGRLRTPCYATTLQE